MGNDEKVYRLTVHQGMAIARMIEKYDSVTLRKPNSIDALPYGYVAGSADLGGRLMCFGIDPDGSVHS